MQCNYTFHFRLCVTLDRVQNIYGVGACMELEWPISGLDRFTCRLCKTTYKILSRRNMCDFIEIYQSNASLVNEARKNDTNLKSCGWPTVIGILGNWFGMKGRGFVLGVWSSCQSVGNIVGALMVNAFIDTGFEYSFLFVSATLAMLSVLIFFTN